MAFQCNDSAVSSAVLCCVVQLGCVVALCGVGCVVFCSAALCCNVWCCVILYDAVLPQLLLLLQ